MSTFSERLAAAKAAEKPAREVVITLDSGLSEQRAELQEKIARAEAEKDDRLGLKSLADDLREQLEELNLAAADSLITLRFTRVSGADWAELTARCPVRLDAAIDRQYGYNMHAVCKLAAPLSGVLVDGDEVSTLSADEWADLFNTISGFEFMRIVDAIYELNEYEPAVRVNELKKELSARLDLETS